MYNSHSWYFSYATSFEHGLHASTSGGANPILNICYTEDLCPFLLAGSLFSILSPWSFSPPSHLCRYWVRSRRSLPKLNPFRASVYGFFFLGFAWLAKRSRQRWRSTLGWNCRPRRKNLGTRVHSGTSRDRALGICVRRSDYRRAARRQIFCLHKLPTLLVEVSKLKS